jgi:hypothetical protein
MAREGLLTPLRGILHRLKHNEPVTREDGVLVKTKEGLLAISLNVISVAGTDPSQRCHGNRVLASDEGRGSPLRSFNHSRNYLGQQERNSLLQRPGVLRRRFRGYGEGLTQFASISTCGHPLFHELTVPFQRLRWAILRLYNQIRSG